MSGTVGRRPRKVLSFKQKVAAIERITVNGETKTSVARDLGVPESTVRGWVKNVTKITARAAARDTEAPLAKKSKKEDKLTTSSESGASSSSGCGAYVALSPTNLAEKRTEHQLLMSQLGQQYAAYNAYTAMYCWYMQQFMQNGEMPQTEPLDLSVRAIEESEHSISRDETLELQIEEESAIDSDDDSLVIDESVQVEDPNSEAPEEAAKIQ